MTIPEYILQQDESIRPRLRAIYATARAADAVCDRTILFCNLDSIAKCAGKRPNPPLRTR